LLNQRLPAAAAQSAHPLVAHAGAKKPRALYMRPARAHPREQCLCAPPQRAHRYNPSINPRKDFELMSQRPPEAGIHRDLRDQLTYASYLGLDQLLSAQHLRSDPPHHDEMLFIVQHQVSELWFKLVLHELRAAILHLQRDELDPCFKILARVKQVQQQLYGQWAVLETLTPSEYTEFRSVLGHASGFQSPQYRELEFMLGNKDPVFIEIFSYDPAVQARLRALLHAPSLYDEFLRYLHRQGHPIPAERVQRDWAAPYDSHPQVVAALTAVYRDTANHWAAYNMCEKLVDLEVNFQLWRFRHLKTVARIIGYKPGTGGSSGVRFLERALDVQLFPELIELRTFV
jgi:tryptophan 2,3-dioxygenase